MNLRWVLPDRSVVERDEPEAEQLLFLLRLTGNVSLGGKRYRVLDTELVVGEQLSVTVTLADRDGEPSRGDICP